MLGWARGKRRLWRGDRNAHQNGLPATEGGHLSWGVGEEGVWVQALSMHFLSFPASKAEAGRRYP